MDLVQAEAVADLIDAASAEAARAARRTLDGEWSARLAALGASLTDLRAEVEAAIDFPEDDLEELHPHRLRQLAVRVIAGLDAALASAAQGQLLAEGLRVAIVGRPNAGKSSLLNALSGRDSAIVTEVPGTTRDTVQVSIQIDGLPVHLTDTAGLRETRDPVERIGVERAWAAARDADLVLLVVDAAAGFGGPEEAITVALPPTLPRLVVWNKIDLTGEPRGLAAATASPSVRLSARTGAGLDELRQALRSRSGYPAGDGLFSARRRHLDALTRARQHLAEAVRLAEGTPRPELLAEELRQAQRAVGEVLGTVTSEDLLDRVFSRFCIGK
jgi:tRNA modification GTPase